MIKTLASLCLLFATTTLSFAQGTNAHTSSPRAETQSGGVETQIIRLVRQIADAVIKRDTVGLIRLCGSLHSRIYAEFWTMRSSWSDRRRGPGRERGRLAVTACQDCA